MNKYRFLCLVVILINRSANAALIDLGTSTVDTSTSLEWLDLTETAGLSYEAVNSQMVAGGDYEGWRHAALEETQQLLSNFGFGVEVGDRAAVPSELSNMANLTSYLGDTFGNAYSSSWTGIGGFTAPPPEPVLQPYWVAAFITFDPDRIHLRTTDANKRHPATAFADSGQFLVRSAVVPPPPAVWLFCTGLLSLFGLSRRKKAA